MEGHGTKGAGWLYHDQHAGRQYICHNKHLQETRNNGSQYEHEHQASADRTAMVARTCYDIPRNRGIYGRMGVKKRKR